MKTVVTLILFWVGMVFMNYANATPYCANHQKNNQLIIAYLGADFSWKLRDEDQEKLREQLSQVSLVNYAFIRLAKDGQGNTVLNMTEQDVENIETIRQLNPKLPIMIAVGGWSERDGFQSLLQDRQRMEIFVNSVKNVLIQYHLDGIDVDWENELLASTREIKGVATLLQQLHASLAPDGYCVTNAVPATPAYWKQYPDAQLWQSAVNWTTVMSYDHFGTFGPKTEHGAALYKNNRVEDRHYSYPTTSGDMAVKHYYKQGLSAEKIILGLPFYCHSYYIKSDLINDNNPNPGLQVAVLDPNISSQVSYQDAYTLYGEQLFAYQNSADGRSDTASFYGLIPLEGTKITRFMSCDSPQSVWNKVAYVEGANSMSQKYLKRTKLGGVSFWSLQQDLPFSNSHSLLRAIHSGFSGMLPSPVRF